MPASSTILIVENDAAICGMIIEVLSGAGYRVYAVGTPKRARALLATVRPDLLICDLDIPSISEIVNEQSQGATAIPVVGMTSNPAQARQMHIPTVAFCLEKPFQIDDLLDCAAAYTNRARVVG
jgi:DNA-binding response OmpR family regulator